MLKKFFRQLRLASLASIIFFFGVSILFAPKAFASENSFVTIVNPVRGADFWGLKNQEPLTVVEEQLKIVEHNGLTATWLLRPDVIFAFGIGQTVFFSLDIPLKKGRN